MTIINRTEIGWREWVDLPELDLPKIKAKIDTGARTSALHAFDLNEFKKDGEMWVRFGIHPLQKNSNLERYCEAKVVDQRAVTDSGGHRENRYVICTPVVMGTETFPIEITLTNRDTMSFRMLIGRTALTDKFAVLPASSFLFGDFSQKVSHLYPPT